MSNEIAGLFIGLLVVLFVGKTVSKVLRDGDLGGILFAMVFIAIIALGALHFANMI